MDTKAQIVGECVKSIRVPGYFPPLPELRQQLRTMVSLMDEPAPALPRIEDLRIPGPPGRCPRASTMPGAAAAASGRGWSTSTVEDGCRVTWRRTTVSAR